MRAISHPPRLATYARCLASETHTTTECSCPPPPFRLTHTGTGGEKNSSLPVRPWDLFGGFFVVPSPPFPLLFQFCTVAGPRNRDNDETLSPALAPTTTGQVTLEMYVRPWDAGTRGSLNQRTRKTEYHCHHLIARPG